MNLDKLKKTILNVSKDLAGREEELCMLDSHVGDGDHGITIKKGFTNIIKMMDSDSTGSAHDFLFEAGLAFSDTAGGVIGPIMASFFFGMAEAIDPGKKEYDTKDIYAMFSCGMKQIQELGGARPGDRTMLDALGPAMETLEKYVDSPMAEALEKMAQSAYDGAMSTKDMVAKTGRARYLGEASKGYIDAGSMSMYYFLRTFAQSVKE